MTTISPPSPSTSLTRAFNLGLTNIWRNKYLSIATVTVIAIIVFTFNIILSIDYASKEVITKTTQNYDLLVYLNNDLDTFSGLALAEEIKKLPEVKEVTFRSKEQAKEVMRESSPEIIQLLERNSIDNPFPPDLKIITNTIEDHQKVLDYLQQKHHNELHPIFNNVINTTNQNLIDSNRENQKIINNLNNNLVIFIQETKEIIFWTILIFILGGLLIMMNAIQLTIFNRQKEIEIMKLVGATYNFIRLPYIFEGIIYASTAVTLSAIITIITSSQTNIGPLNVITPQQYSTIFSLELIITITLGIIGSLIIVNRYLKEQKS